MKRTVETICQNCRSIINVSFFDIIEGAHFCTQCCRTNCYTTDDKFEALKEICERLDDEIDEIKSKLIS